MTAAAFVDHLDHLFTTRGHHLYGGEAVTQLEHALQAADLARAAAAPPADVVAALLHDVGHLLHALGDDCADRGIDDRHEDLGVRFLAKHLPAAVTEPVRLHVAAKRYLCATDAGYLAALSPASVQSLALQGGPMSPAEVAAFHAGPHFAAAVALRRRDDEAKVVGRPTPPFAAFRPFVEQCLVQPV